MKSDLDLSEFLSDCKQFNIALSDDSLEQLITYYELLNEWNKVMNLTAITDFEGVFKKHFIDSLSIAQILDFNKDINVIDIGTGAGFPGLVLKIAFPNIRITLLDSLNKRITFLSEVVSSLKLKDVNLLHGRAEDVAKDKLYRETYDLAVSRAVANLSTLSEYCLPFVKTGGYFVSYKSEKATDEIKDAGNALQILGGAVTKEEGFYLPGTDIYRNLILIEKQQKTPEKYPRKAGLPAREPLI